MSTQFTGPIVVEKVKEIAGRAGKEGSNVTRYSEVELRDLAERTGQRNLYGAYNWDTHVRSRSAKFSVCIGGDEITSQNRLPEQKETLQALDLAMARVFGGEVKGKQHLGHANKLSIDYERRVMGSGADKNFTFNCHFLISAKSPYHHHVSYMWGKMLRSDKPIPGAEEVYLLMLPDIPTGVFGRFYTFPENRVTVGLGSDYMGEVKKGFLRMAMYLAKQKGILGIHAGAKIVRARNQKTGEFQRYGVAIMGNSGTGKTTNTGHTHFLNRDGEESLVVQDDFVGLRVKDGQVLGTEQALFLKTDLDADDVLLRPATQSPEFTSQNLYINYRGEIGYLSEDLSANGRGILPISVLPADRRHTSIDLPPLDELDHLMIFFNTRHSMVVPILQRLNSEQAGAYFMLGESVETAAGDPTRAGMSIRVPGTNPFIVGNAAVEGNIFYEFIKRFEDKVTCFLLNTGGVGEIPNPEDRTKPIRPANRPWKPGIGYVTRALFRDSGEWEKNPDFGTSELVGGVTDENDHPYDMSRFSTRKQYDDATRVKTVVALNQDRLKHLEKYPDLNPAIVKGFVESHRMTE